MTHSIYLLNIVQHTFLIFILHVLFVHAVLKLVEALHHKPEDREFDSIW